MAAAQALRSIRPSATAITSISTFTSSFFFSTTSSSSSSSSFSSSLSASSSSSHFPRRTFASSSSTVNVFDRSIKRLQKNTASSSPHFSNYDYLHSLIASHLIDRLEDVNRKFPQSINVGSRHGELVRALYESGNRNGIREMRMMDWAEKSLERAKEQVERWEREVKEGTFQVESTFETSATAASLSPPPASSAFPTSLSPSYTFLSSEFPLPVPPASTDLILSSLSLHWVNALPSLLQSIRSSLRPDGLFLGSLFGGATLQELRSAFTLADTERLGGVGSHISPFVSGSDLSNLMSDAGFSLPTIDTEVVTYRYPDMFTLCEHLQMMGEQNCNLGRGLEMSGARKDVFSAAASIYEEMYRDEDGMIPATFQVYYVIGWAPDKTKQSQPLERGSATHKFSSLNALLKEVGKDPSLLSGGAAAAGAGGGGAGGDGGSCKKK